MSIIRLRNAFFGTAIAATAIFAVTSFVPAPVALAQDEAAAVGEAAESEASGAQAQGPSLYAVCKTYNRGTKTTAACIGYHRTSETTACTTYGDCGTDIAELCRKVGVRHEVDLKEFSSGLGTFASQGECEAKCEHSYGEANWGKYGRKCLGTLD
ncbi:hypothetical protein [Croceicoccus mobilis]|uniref:Uncharacterized protein n=1 Tax=Croceicoccus mobilis TaxID=1703339 RepID=A0A916YWB3_9SPHN|nr:hypothetical protein [Croceicoccus mobilis]GGD64422.1 hypothetical protein GCM10010990_12330 [Croceicoccus mobilis]